MLYFPAIRMQKAHWTRLMHLAFDTRYKFHRTATFLGSEMQRAIVVDQISEADEIVQMNTWVHYQLDKRPTEARVLVHPEDYVAGELHLSVLTSLGAALVGMRVGDVMAFMCTEGTLHLVTPVAVDRQPGAAERVRKNLPEERVLACCHSSASDDLSDRTA